MNPTLIELVIAMMMIAVVAILIIWFQRYKAGASERRMKQMLKNAGLDPEIAIHATTEVIIREVRSRCRKCQAEDVCERWLAGKETGENDFCPNAGVFQMLAEHAGVTK